ncbi:MULTISPECIES: enoyl-CoA hydratase-related protein [unclassified Novosphingobium]|uniref:enoyl-CoA hydratase-related protein n=1 Tax=unclassified Novosphingobium TaxID=2644732 RepID=UPI00135A19AF|nr:MULTISPECIES: enoyl-CoA hydratase-related protein [unclassified Novosphingobium]
MSGSVDIERHFCRLETDGVVAVVTLNRPERRNALHPAAHHELDTVFDTLANREGLRCIILTGEGDAFCSGYDLRDNLETGVMEIAASGFGGLTGRTDYPLPIVAAVNGVCIGGGFEMALACDIVIAADTARFALPEAKVGWSPLAGGLQRLPRIVGEKQALAMVLTGRAVDAAEGYRLGFVSEVTPAASLMETARRWAGEIAVCAPLAIRCNREVLRASLDMPLADALDIANFPIALTVMESEDGTEGKRAFTEKRAPVWKGR